MNAQDRPASHAEVRDHGPVMPVADAHVDVLYRLWREGLDPASEHLQAAVTRLRRGGVRTQVYALFVFPHLSHGEQLHAVLRQVDLFYSRVCADGQVAPVRSQREWDAARGSGKICGLLSLEGGGCLGGDTGVLRMLHQLGVRGLGLTWNPANDLADGCREPRNAGLTEAGRRIVREMERLGMWIDLAHLGDAGVRDILALTDGPVMASHANARAVHDHPRNLTDDVIREIIRRRGWMGLTFEASFVADPEIAKLDDVFAHLDHLLDLGAEDAVGLGSDFDGTSHPLPGLAAADDYLGFAALVVQRYGETVARKLLHQNLERFLLRHLPAV